MNIGRGIRLVPIVLIATACLLVLKTAGILSGSGYTLGSLQGARAQAPLDEPEASVSKASDALIERVFGAPALAPAKRSWAQEMFNFPEVTGSVDAAKPTTGGGAELPKPAPDRQAKASPAEARPNAAPGPLVTDGPLQSAGERAVLERLQERRQELEARERELEIREGLLKAAEKRIEDRIGELKEIETQVNGAQQKKDEAETARFKNLITMYENMKARDAARVFDRLDMKVLIEVATQINPRRMSDILAQMSPEAAERLTVELASRGPGSGRATSAAELPKIEGKPRI
jgi:flagellar motility protein MotE (MotC chaperone)